MNVAGYYGIFQGLKAKSSIEWSAAVSEHEDAMGPALTFKIPISVPYAADSHEYDNISGQFEYGGEVYQLVKQKLLKDTLYVVGVKDEQSSMWGKALADFVMTFSDTSDDSSSAESVPTPVKDFVSTTIGLTGQTSGWTIAIAPSAKANNLVDTYCVSVVHPPERG
jgi:hypothetical protein